MAASAAAALLLAHAFVACSLLDPLDGLTGGSAADAAAAEASVDAADGGPDFDAGGPAACEESAYDGGKVRDGFLCGVGACRKRLTGPSCRIRTLPDGGTEHPCRTAFPAETAGDGTDDDCNGVVDDGYPSAAPDAGIECRGCAFARAVQRLADGTLETAGGSQNRAAYENTRDCINSERCTLGTASWMRNVSMMTCRNYCASIGGVCKEACSTSTAKCNGAAVATGLGTFADDYGCVVPPGHPNGVAGTPLTGDCDATFPGVIDPSADFNLACCCEL